MKKTNALKKIAIVYRPDLSASLTLAKTLAQWLRENGHEAYTAPEQKPIRGTAQIRRIHDLQKMNLVVVLGGDGTYLRASRLLAGAAIPILGVNLGSLGFLTPIRKEEVFTAVEQSLLNKMELTPRSIMQVEVHKKGKTSTSKSASKSAIKKSVYLALNDIVIERGSLSQLINICIHSERFLVSEIKADGLIISSPTGSTAYNLAAGGPILHPDANVVVVTPIAPHSLTSRPLIFPDDKKLSFRLVKKLQPTQKQVQMKAFLVLDGTKVGEIGPEDEIIVHRSPKDHLMVTFPNHNYFHLLREKLRFGDR